MGIITNKKRFWFILLILLLLFSGLYFLPNKLKKSVTIEAGVNSIDESEFLKNKKHVGSFITDMSTINLKQPGIYEIKIKIGVRKYSSKLEIIDTIPPRGNPVNREIWLGEELEAKDFVENIIDFTDVRVSYSKKPNFNLGGQQIVEVTLEDTSGNKTRLNSQLNIKVDSEPPKIKGVKDIIVYIGDTISYKKGIKVVDNRDQNIELKIDSSNVNLKKEGNYEVEYSATDTSENKTKEIAKVEVRKKPKSYTDPELIHKLADSVLDKIINEKMNDKEKLWKIFKWTNSHISYIGYSDKTDWIQEANRGIKKGTGDCFTYYATARELLTRAGFENMTVTRIGGTHFWNLVYYEGDWYHFDTSPYRRGYPNVCFLHTDKQVAEYSKIRKNYYNFDKSKYPSTPKKPIKPIK